VLEFDELTVRSLLDDEDASAISTHEEQAAVNRVRMIPWRR